MIEFKIDNKYLLLFFTSIFLLVESADYLVPYRAAGYSEDSLINYYAVFFFVFSGLLISCFFVYSVKISFPSLATVEKLTGYIFYMSVLALMLVSYDRLFIQHVDYSAGVAQAREMWRAMADQRSGVSSIFNVLGNLLFPFVYFGIAFCIVFFELSVKLRRYFYFSALLVLIFSALTGGRELVLVLFGVFLSSLAVRAAIGFPVLSKRMKRDLFVVFSVAAFFSVYIGFLRSQSYDFGMEEYARSLATRLGASGERFDSSNSYTPEIILPVLIYLAHVKWIFIGVLENGGGEGLSTFRQLFKMLYEYIPALFGWADYQAPNYSPNWISLVGSVYYDLGWVGVFLYSIFLMFSPLLFFLVFRVREFNKSLFSFSFYIFFCSVIVFSPFAFLFEVVQFIYLVLFVFIALFLSFVFSYVQLYLALD